MPEYRRAGSAALSLVFGVGAVISEKGELVSFCVATWPPPDEFQRSPYLGAFYEAVKPYGILPAAAVEPTLEWLRAHRASIDGIHIHWPDGLWRRRTKGSLARLKRALEYRRFVRAAHASGLKIIWTVHNLARHEGASWLDRYCYRVLASHAHLLICHSRWAAQITASTYAPTGRVVVVPIGSFPGVYPAPRERAVVLAELGLRADCPVVCSLGHLRVYKGLDVACDAVLQLKGRVQLVVAGRPFGRLVDISKLQKSLRGANAGLLLDRELSNQEFSDIVAASEAVLLPYKNITGSAVLLTAWTLGRGVIASDLPYFREIAGADAYAGTLFPAGSAVGLRDAIEAYLQIPSEQRNDAARRLAAYYSWERCVEPLAEIFRAWQRDKEA